MSGSVVEIAGIGFGPSNLALAIALEEEGAPPAPDGTRPLAEFFEKQPSFGWHRGMLMENATMQVSFLKDLVTMRNPASRYSFVSYLKSRGRLASFINGKVLYPLRVEFHDYLEWAAGRFASQVTYGAEVVDLAPVLRDGLIEALDVVVRHADGRPDTVRRARNVVLGVGLEPRLPPEARGARRVWHSAHLLDRVAELDPAAPLRLVVVGSGQSAAEVAEYLHDRFPGAEVCAVYSRYGYSVADDSPFANAVFDPDAVDEFYRAPEPVKEALLGYHRNTNYSVVDLELSRSLHQRVYREAVLGDRRLHMINLSRIRGFEERDDRVVVEVEHLPSGAVRRVDADAVVCATGYRPRDLGGLLRGVSAECKRDSAGRLAVDRDYRIVTSDAMRCGLYLQGAGVEHSHGLSAGLLSNIAVRAGEVARSVLAG